MIMRSDTCFLTCSHLSSFSSPRSFSTSWVRSEMPGNADEPYLLNLAGANRECLVSGLSGSPPGMMKTRSSCIIWSFTILSLIGLFLSMSFRPSMKAEQAAPNSFTAPSKCFRVAPFSSSRLSTPDVLNFSMESAISSDKWLRL